MQIIKNFIWTWCPKCMVRTKHVSVKAAFQCTDCGCLHVGEFLVPKQNLLEAPVQPFEQASPAG